MAKALIKRKIFAKRISCFATVLVLLSSQITYANVVFASGNSLEDTSTTSSEDDGTGDLVDGKLENGLLYRMDSDTAIITGYEGTELSVTIPEGIEGKPVKAIGYQAFKEKNVEEVIIPEGVTDIGEEAFYRSSVVSVIFPESLTDIGTYAFYYCKNLKDVLLKGNTKIGELAFCQAGNGELTVDFGNGNIEIGSSAFWFADLKEINIPLGVTQIGSDAFANSKLEKVIFNATVDSIGVAAFRECENLKSIYIGDNVKIIDEMAFLGCKNLNDVKGAKYLESIKDRAFEGCTHLTAVCISDLISYISKDAFKYNFLLILCEGNEYLKGYAEENGIQYSELAINDTEIKTEKSSDGILYEFYAGKGIITGSEYTDEDTLFLPAKIGDVSIAAVGEKAFEYNKYNSIVIGNGIEYLGYQSFYNSYNIKGIELPESITEMGDMAFSYCIELESVKINGPLVMKMNCNLFSNCKKLRYVDFGAQTKSISTAFWDTCIEEVVIPQSVEDLSYAFHYIETLKNVVIYSDADLLNTFSGTLLENIELKGNTKRIGAESFSGCTKLISVVLPETVESIESKAFASCSRLSYVYIPEKVSYIDDDAFEYDSMLTIVGKEGSYAESYALENNIPFMSGNIPEIRVDEGVTSDGRFEYLAINDNITLQRYVADETVVIVPSEIQTSGGNYKINMLGETLFTNNDKVTDVVIEDGVTGINRYSFMYCKNLKNITIPESITVVHSAAFYGCEKLESIKFSGAVKIGSDAFAECNSLKEIDLGEKTLELGMIPKFVEALHIPTLTTMGNIGSFANYGGMVGNNSLKKVTFAKDNVLTRLPINAFADFYALKEVALSDNLKELTWRMFKNCISLNYIKLPESVMSIQEEVFYECESLTGIYIPATTTWIADNAFEKCYFLTISAPKGSYAIEYAKTHNIKYIELTDKGDDDGIMAEIPGNVIDGIEDGKDLPILSDDSSMIFDPGAVIAIKHMHGNKDVELDYTVVKNVDSDNGASDEFNDAANEVIQGGGKLMDFSLMDKDGNKVLFSLDDTDGSVTITIPYEAPVSANKITVYYIAPDGTKTDMQGVYSPSDKTITFKTTHFSCFAIVDDTTENDKPDVVYGDANSDGTVNSKDAVMLKKHLAGYKDLGINTDACDVNVDGEVNSKDAVLILKKLAGYDVELGK